jgi:HAD superfamily phosphoserine phosphatase-like hydrolase
VRPIAAFDWDDTVTEGDVSLALLRRIDLERGTTLHDDYFRLLADHGRDVAYPRITQWFAGETPASFAAIAARIVDLALESGEVRYRPDMLRLVDAMTAHGWEVWVVSASPAVVVREIAGRIGIPPERVLAMELELDADGRFTETVLQPATYCAGKARALEAALPRAPDFCAGDSRSDADMMALARHALLVHGHDVELHAEAVARGWWVQAGWKHTPAEPGVKVATDG